MKRKRQRQQMPPPEEVLLTAPPYSRWTIDPKAPREIFRVEFFEGTVHAFCKSCSRESVFRSVVRMPSVGPVARGPSPVESAEELITKYREAYVSQDGVGTMGLVNLDEYAAQDRAFHVPFVCTKECSHTLKFFFCVEGGEIIKAGQYPSLADLRKGELSRYRKCLDKERYAELNRAIGLSAHGVGIGSFVYLRRLIEYLLERARAEASKDGSWDERAYDQARIVEKIRLLEHHLPRFLTENRKIYSVLSKGIHELSEEECLEYFEPLRVSIELMLDEEIQREERKAKESKAKSSLSRIFQAIQ